MSEALHLYCVTGNGAELDFDSIRFEGRQVSSVRHGGLAVLVSPAPLLAYKAMRREELICHLVAHQAVIEKVMKDHTVVPVKFGTTARDDQEVLKILTTGYPQLRAALEAMEGKIELDLVAQWRDLTGVFRQIGEEPEIRRQKASIALRRLEDSTEGWIKIGQMVKARLDQRREALGAEIVEALKPLARDLCPHALLDDRMVLNTAFLVERAKEGEVGETLKRLNDRYGDHIDFRCVGPLPPYSFATVEVRTFEFDTVDLARRLLGLDEKATLKDVKEAYRRLVHEYHPDHITNKAMGGQRANGAFEAVTEAYRLLGEYCQAGSSFLASDVREVVAVRLLQWSRESGGA